MNYTTGKFFLDTNFLVYLFSEHEKEKRSICRDILQQGREKAVFVLSTQVLKEFAHVMLGKYKVPSQSVKKLVTDLSRLEVVQVDPSLILQAMDTHQAHGFSFWDSLIRVSARSARCNVLLTEDMQHDRALDDLLIWNPFHTL